MNKALWIVATALSLLTSCNEDEGACWLRSEDDGQIGGGGGPIVPSGGGFGDAPNPQNETTTVVCTGDPQGKWSDIPECDLQYEQDTQYCNRFYKKSDSAKCRSIQSERLAYCIKTGGQTGHPPRWNGGKDD